MTAVLRGEGLGEAPGLDDVALLQPLAQPGVTVRPSRDQYVTTAVTSTDAPGAQTHRGSGLA